MPKTLYIWHSKAAAESATELARRLEVQHGLKPPADKNVVTINWGAKPPEEFDASGFEILNPPDKVNKHRNRKSLFDTLRAAEMGCPPCVDIEETSEYTDICNKVGVKPEEGLLLLTASGSSSAIVTNEAELKAVLGEKKKFTLATDASPTGFSANERVRIFVGFGSVLGAVHKPRDISPEAFAACATCELKGNSTAAQQEEVEGVVLKMIKQGIIQPLKSYWLPKSIVSESNRVLAVKVADTLGLDFCAIDFDPEMTRVLNVVTTPNLFSARTVITPLVNEMSAWATERTKTVRETVLDMINAATDAEIGAFLGLARKVKSKRKTGGRKAQSVAG
jgi:hypothetical protein